MSRLIGAVLAGVLMAAGSAAAQDDKKPDLGDLQKQIDELRKQVDELRKPFKPMNPPALPNILQQTAPSIRFGRADARLGVMVEKPGDTLADHLGLKKDSGLVVTHVMPDTPAAKAGLKEHDVLVQFAGKDVPDDAFAFARIVGDVKGDAAVEMVVMRKGKTETIKDVKLPEAKPLIRPNFKPLSFGAPGVVIRVECR